MEKKILSRFAVTGILALGLAASPLPLPGFGNEDDRGQRGRPRSIGSGVIIDAKQGLVVTNHHVAQGEQKLFITLRDRREFEAAIVRSDEGPISRFSEFPLRTLSRRR